MGKRLWTLATCLIAAIVTAWAATDTRQGAFHPSMQSMQASLNGIPNMPPVAVMGTSDALTFEWDVLSAERDFLRYKIVHCDANWQPSNIAEIEYIAGINEGEITDYVFSQATNTNYVHYALDFPSEDMQPTISGNYLLQIYPENDPEDVWGQFRFMISEQTAEISASATSATDIDFNKGNQQLSVTANVENSNVQNPYLDLTLKIQQNSREDNQVSISHPLRMANMSTAIYEHLPELIFPAGNEYRRFETVSLYYPTMGVEKITYFDPYYHFVLIPDEPRQDQMYLYDQTLNGGFVIRSDTSSQSEAEADYGIVHFALDMPRIANADVHIDADFTHRKLDATSKMSYNPASEMYEYNALLKQGAYSYQYLIVPKGSDQGATKIVEGDKYQTHNRYLIMLYARNPMDRYDRLIGVSQIEF